MQTRFAAAFTCAIWAFASLVAARPTEAQVVQPESTPRTPRIVVSGTGSAKTAPDIAFVSLGVMTTGKRAQEATQANAAASQKVMAAIRQQGVDEKDIQTTSFYVQPVPDQRDPTKINGYQVTNVVRTTVRKIANVGKVVDAGLDAGANNVQGISFGLEERGPAEEKALAEAVREARRKAETMARAAGVRLGGIQEINSAFGGRPVPMFGDAGAEMMAARVATPVNPGELEVSASVTMIFTILQADAPR